MAENMSNGVTWSSLVSILNSMHQSLGRVEASQVANRQTVLDMASTTHLRIQDLKEEVFHRFIRVEARMDRIETGKTGHGWRMPPWWVILRIGGFILSALLLIGGHMTVPEFKQLLGLGAPH
jgi:hypothetical protein